MPDELPRQFVVTVGHDGALGQAGSEPSAELSEMQSAKSFPTRTATEDHLALRLAEVAGLQPHAAHRERGCSPASNTAVQVRPRR